MQWFENLKIHKFYWQQNTVNIKHIKELFFFKCCFEFAATHPKSWDRNMFSTVTLLAFLTTVQ